MDAAIVLVQTIAGFALLIFGGWVTVKGIRIITQHYPLTLKPGEPLPAAFSEPNQPTNLVAAMMSLVNAEIASLPARKSSTAPVDRGYGDGTPGGAGSPLADEEPLDGDNTVPTGEEPVLPAPILPEPVEPAAVKDRDASAILEGAASIIEALPKLLNANFGPATVVCGVGMLIIAGGFYLLLQLSVGV